MNERKISELQKEYRAFFLEKMRLYGVKSPAELTKEKKSEFFISIKQDWDKIKITKKQTKQVYKREAITEKPKRTFQDNTQFDTKEKGKQKNQEPRQERRQEKELPSLPRQITKQVIKSEPNKEQTDDLKILFTPNNDFTQGDNYIYPVVKMPKQNSNLKLPRIGRSNQKGFKENDFFNEIKLQIFNIEITNNVHMVIPNYGKPYEPDIVLFDKKLNLYIDVEIDEPYDGFYRYPTHNYRAEDDFKQDNIRDLFFTESGWVVIRFTEKQVHKQPKECIDYIKNVINSLHSNEFSKTPKCEVEYQWNENQCIQWQLNNYREKYLEIHSFDKRTSQKEVVVDEQENETIETKIQRTQFEDIEKQFDKDLHKYFHPKDKTGNAEYISVTTLVERFFQFDLLRYIEKKAKDENKSEEEVLDEHLYKTYQAAILGTELHLQIENYFTQKPFDDSLQEFKYFLNFEKEKIIPKDLTFTEAEKKIFYPKFNVAGTVDCLFKNSEGKYVMIDWKRSKKLIVKSTDKPDKRGFQIEIEGLNTMTNCSYYRYCIQQNNYHTIKLPEMTKETTTIFNSINHKI